MCNIVFLTHKAKIGDTFGKIYSWGSGHPKRGQSPEVSDVWSRWVKNPNNRHGTFFWQRCHLIFQTSPSSPRLAVPQSAPFVFRPCSKRCVSNTLVCQYIKISYHDWKKCRYLGWTSTPPSPIHAHSHLQCYYTEWKQLATISLHPLSTVFFYLVSVQSFGKMLWQLLHFQDSSCKS